MIATQTSSTVSPKRSFMGAAANGKVGWGTAGLLPRRRQETRTFRRGCGWAEEGGRRSG